MFDNTASTICGNDFKTHDIPHYTIVTKEAHIFKERPRIYAVCKKHGRTLHRMGSDGRNRCLICVRQEKARRRRSLKQRAIEYKGGKCQRCGYDTHPAALEFHHRNKKNFKLSKMADKNWRDIMRELDNTDLLCANCHREMHYQDIDKI